MITADPLELIAGIGIGDDSNAEPASPRQILIGSVASYHELDLQPGILRENVLVDFRIEAFTSGDVIQLGPSARVRLTYLCETCHKLRTDARTVAALHGRRGFLGRVVESGVVKPGDVVAVERSRYACFPQRVRDRVLHLVANIPPGRVVDYLSIVRLLGLPSAAYARVIPRLLAAGSPNLPVHRVVASGFRLVTAHVPQQQDLLNAEGVVIRDGAVLREHAWAATDYFRDHAPA